MPKSTVSKVTTTSVENFKIVDKLSDRSDLSDEMKDLCAKLPIYRIRKLEKKQNDADQMEDHVQQSDEVDDAPERVARGNKMIKWKSRTFRSYNSPQKYITDRFQLHETFGWPYRISNNETFGIFTFFKKPYVPKTF